MARHLRDPNSAESREMFGLLPQFIDRARAAGVPNGAVLFPALYGLGPDTSNYPFAYMNDRVKNIYADWQVPYLDLLPRFRRLTTLGACGSVLSILIPTQRRTASPPSRFSTSSCRPGITSQENVQRGRQSAVSSRQSAVGSQQSAVSSRQSAVGSRQSASAVAVSVGSATLR